MTKRTMTIVIVLAVLALSALAPVAVAQYQTRIYFDSGGNRLMVDDGGELVINDGGALSIESGATVEISDATYLEANAAMVVSAPTAIGTATPPVVINSSSNKPNLFEARKASTPVFSIGNTGNVAVAGNLAVTGDVTGKVLKYDTSGQQMVCGTDTITGTGILAHGLATPVAVYISMGEDFTEANAFVTFTNAAATVTAKVWQYNATPTAGDAGVAVDWCVVGTP